MKFSIGFIAGAVIGGYIVTNMTEQQRSKVAEKASAAVDKARNSTVGSSIVDNASDVQEAASERVAGAVDTAGTKLTDAVGTNGTT